MNQFRNWTLTDWLFHLESAHQHEIQLGLERITVVAQRLNLIRPLAKVITVAGTNGKGSTVAALEAIYMDAGFNVATYTSPHLFVFNERICVNHKPISDEMLCLAFQTIEESRDNIPLTYFEMTTLAALWYFQQVSLDLIILEVGMGGRLDATNIIDADLAIITTIDLDHQEYLGHDLEAIGYEKAGIMRRGKPCIYADFIPPTSVLQHAQKLNAPIYRLGIDYHYYCDENAFCLTFADQKIVMDLPNIHSNAVAVSIFAVHCLQSFLPIQFETLSQSIKSIKILGRKQWVLGNVSTLYDVAHNPQAVRLLAENIQRHQAHGRILAVFSALKDKDLCGLIKPMLHCVDAWYPALLSNKRAASESLLKEAFKLEGVTISSCFYDPIEAYRAALLDAKNNDLIVVYGSFFMVSAVYQSKESVHEICN